VTRELPPYRVRAVNTATDSENKIHDDSVAAQYGFRGGLVPGIIVYGYMTVPVIEFARDWLERGTFDVRFVQPFYDGELVVVRVSSEDERCMQISAEREDGNICAVATSSILTSKRAEPPSLPQHPLPADRPVPYAGIVIPGTPLGTVTQTLDSLEPHALLRFSNELLMQNFKLGPWIHVRSEITNWSAARLGDEVSARGRIHDRFDRKGREFVVAEVTLVANGNRLLQTVRHTAIYQL